MKIYGCNFYSAIVEGITYTLKIYISFFGGNFYFDKDENGLLK